MFDWKRVTLKLALNLVVYGEKVPQNHTITGNAR
jgi:hypothetical protein